MSLRLSVNRDIFTILKDKNKAFILLCDSDNKVYITAFVLY